MANIIQFPFLYFEAEINLKLAWFSRLANEDDNEVAIDGGG